MSDQPYTDEEIETLKASPLIAAVPAMKRLFVTITAQKELAVAARAGGIREAAEQADGEAQYHARLRDDCDGQDAIEHAAASKACRSVAGRIRALLEPMAVPLCGDNSRGGTLMCWLERGHDGDHVGIVTAGKVSWPRER